MNDFTDAFPYILGILGVLTFIGAQVGIYRQARKETRDGQQQQIALKDQQLKDKDERIRNLEADVKRLTDEKLDLYERLFGRGGSRRDSP